MLSGARRSSGAEARETDVAFELSEALKRAEAAAAEDGRAPVNTHGADGAGEGGRLVKPNLTQCAGFS